MKYNISFRKETAYHTNFKLNTNGEFNVGTGIDISIEELAKKIAAIVKFKGEILWNKNMPDGTPRKILDISRLTKLGWESKIDLTTGLTKTINALDISKF